MCSRICLFGILIAHCIGCTYWNGIVESSSISYYAVYTVSLWYLPFWNFDYTLYWWVESVDGHYFTLQTLDDSIV